MPSYRAPVVFIKQNMESIFWIGALVLLFFMNVEGGWSLCIFSWLGSGCPGCGIGHSIHSALHLDFAASIKEHPLGIPAVIIIVARVTQLLLKPKLTYDKQ